MDDSFLANVELEGDMSEQSDTTETPVEESNESVNDNTEAPPTETNEDADKPSQEGDNTPDEDNIPFHKHPRWQELQRERVELKESQDKLLREIEELKTQKQPVHEEVKLPESWLIRYGDSAESKTAYQKYMSEELPQLKKEIMSELKAEQEQAAKKDQEVVKWVESEVSKVATEYNIDFAKNESLRNEYLAFMNQRRPTDVNGNIDFKSGWQWFKETQQVKELNKAKKQEDRKKVASLTSSDSKAEEKKDTTLTSKQLRHMGWSDLIN